MDCNGDVRRGESIQGKRGLSLANSFLFSATGHLHVYDLEDDETVTSERTNERNEAWIADIAILVRL